MEKEEVEQGPEEPAELTALKESMKDRLPESFHDTIDSAHPSFKPEEGKVLQTLADILSEHKTARDFMKKETDYYPKFLEEAKSMGLKKGFDEPGQKIDFKVKKANLLERKGTDFLFSKLGDKTSKSIEDVDQSILRRTSNVLRRSKARETVLRGRKTNSYLPSKRSKKKSITASGEEELDFDDETLSLIQEQKEDIAERMNERNSTEPYDLMHYLDLSIAEARIGAPDLFESIQGLHEKEKYRKMYSLGTEFLEDRVKSDIIEQDSKLPETAKKKLEKRIDEKVEPLKEVVENLEQEKKDEKEKEFELELGEKGAKDLLKGVVSQDCSSFTRGFAFAAATAKHVLDPGFLNFKIYQKKDEEREWVGNVYTLVSEVDKDPSLVIDAIQTHPEKWISSRPEHVVDQITQAVKKYAEKNGFENTYLSSFVSNRRHLQSSVRRNKNLEEIKKRVRKLGNHEHLEELDLKTEGKMGGKEYLETFNSGRTNKKQEKKDSVNQEVRLYKV